jgi:hypothetical protein
MIDDIMTKPLSVMSSAKGPKKKTKEKEFRRPTLNPIRRRTSKLKSKEREDIL